MKLERLKTLVRVPHTHRGRDQRRRIDVVHADRQREFERSSKMIDATPAKKKGYTMNEQEIDKYFEK